MVITIRFQKLLIFIVISCVLLDEFTHSSPLQTDVIAANQIAIDRTKLSIQNEQNQAFPNNIDEDNRKAISTSKLIDDNDDDDDDDKKEEKKEEKKEDKKDDNDDDKTEDSKKENVDDKKEEKNENDDKDENKTTTHSPMIDEKLDTNQKEEKSDPPNFDDSSQEEDSHSNPDTEEEGASNSESDEDDKGEEDEPLIGKLEKKLLIIMASGFRYDYLHIQKLNSIKEILKTGVTAKVKPVFPSNAYPNYYSLMTGLQPIKNGFIDDEMYDIRYKEPFPGKTHKHKHWWNKVVPLWITAMNEKIKVASYWWRGACKITIKKRTLKNCVDRKDKVSDNEVSKQLENIVEQFSENKLDLALVSYEEIDDAGHTFGPESYKLRKAVRNFDKILGDLLKELDEKNIEDKVNLIVVTDHGMISIGEKIDLEKFIDFNDIDKFVNTGTFAMLLPEDNKEDYVFNQLRNAHIEGLNVYKKPDFPSKFKYDKAENDLLLPIILTTDKGFYIGEPSVNKEVDASDDDSDEAKKGIHGYHPLHVKEMKGAMFGTGPDLEKNRVVNTIDQVDLYNLFCKLLRIQPHPNDGDREVAEKFLHGSNSEEHNENDNNNEKSDEDSGDIENGYAPEVKIKKPNANLPVYRSRWALRGNAISITMSSSLQLIVSMIILMSLFIIPV